MKHLIGSFELITFQLCGSAWLSWCSKMYTACNPMLQLASKYACTQIIWQLLWLWKLLYFHFLFLRWDCIRYIFCKEQVSSASYCCGVWVCAYTHLTRRLFHLLYTPHCIFDTLFYCPWFTAISSQTLIGLVGLQYTW